jgi:predicted nucleic acid-binding protein
MNKAGKSVMLDTSFLITLLDAKRPHHDDAKQYFKLFVEQSYLIYISSIVVSEYCHKGHIEELPIKYVFLLPFNIPHAVKCAELDFKEHRVGGDSRDCAKDDFKILAQTACEGCDFIITDDTSTLFQYVAKLNSEGKLESRAIKLDDGFDIAFVNADKQRDLPMADEK